MESDFIVQLSTDRFGSLLRSRRVRPLQQEIRSQDSDPGSHGQSTGRDWPEVGSLVHLSRPVIDNVCVHTAG